MGGVVDDITDFGEDLLDAAGDLIGDIGDELERVGDRIEETVKDIPKFIVDDVLDDALGVVQLPTPPKPFDRGTDQEIGAPAPVPTPFRRPKQAPPSAEQVLDRRRSVASAIRRRRRSASILADGGPPETPLGGA